MRGPLITLFANSKTNISSINSITKTLNLLEKLSKDRLITQGNTLHAHLIKIGTSSNKYVAIKLLILYLKCQKKWETDQMLKQFNGFNLVAHNCLMNASVEHGDLDEARKMFDEMPERNEVSWTALISGFMRCGRVSESMWYFERNPFQNVVSWTAAINGYAKNGMNFDAMGLFRKMVESGVLPNSVTFTSVVRACAEMADFGLGMSVLGMVVKVGFEDNVSVSNSLITFYLRLREVGLARKVFSQMEDRDVVTWTAIMDMYIDIGDLSEARRIFDEMPERNEVSWGAMISRYGQSGNFVEAVDLFRQMVRLGLNPTVSCFASTINAVANLVDLQAGMTLHGHVTKIGMSKDVFVSCSLIDLYSRCGEMENARIVFYLILHKNVVCWNSMVSGYSMNKQLEKAEAVFNHIPKKNSVSWNTMISGYLGNDQSENVFEVFNGLLLSGETPDISTFSSILSACASSASLEKGQNLHGKAFKLGFQDDVFIGTALTDMYAKCGDIRSSKKVFDKMAEKNEVSWTAMIQGLAENGFAKESLSLFEEMVRTTTLIPNEIIIAVVLFACSHCGLVDEGLQFFSSMEKAYNIKPNYRHYTGLVDMLSRCGRLYEAECVITNMPFQPDCNMYAALLSGCSRYKDELMADRVVKKIRELDENKSEGYVLLSNIYASAGKWAEVLKTRSLMKEKGLTKNIGCSWVEIRNRTHLFYSGDGSNFLRDEAYEILELLKSEMLAVYSL